MNTIKNFALRLGIIALFFYASLPVEVFAQEAGVKGLIVSVGSIISLLIPLTAGIALLYFFWGLAKFILNAGSEEAREQGKEVMKWGIISLFVLVSIWGIVRYLQSDLGVGPLPLGGFDSTPGECGIDRVC